MASFRAGFGEVYTDPFFPFISQSGFTTVDPNTGNVSLDFQLNFALLGLRYSYADSLGSSLGVGVGQSVGFLGGISVFAGVEFRRYKSLQLIATASKTTPQGTAIRFKLSTDEDAKNGLYRALFEKGSVEQLKLSIAMDLLSGRGLRSYGSADLPSLVPPTSDAVRNLIAQPVYSSGVPGISLSYGGDFSIFGGLGAFGSQNTVSRSGGNADYL